MAEQNQTGGNPKEPLFGKQAFGGYSVADVDAFAEQARKELDQLRLELRAVTNERERVKAELEALRQEHTLLSERAAADSQLVQSLSERVEALSAEADRERGEAANVDEILKAAHAAAQQLRADAKRESEQMMRIAESRLDRLVAEMRVRSQQLQDDFDRAKAEYSDFLSEVRSVAHTFIRRIDEKQPPL